MILAVDVQYADDHAYVAAVAFNDWNAEQAAREYESSVDGIADYVPGQFYKRELPCILKLLNEHKLTPDVIVIDGYVYLGDKKRPGLGMYLYNALEGKSKIVGVAKRAFYGVSDKQKIFRGNSKVPLYVTAIGIEIETAKQNIIKMRGSRIPTLLKHVDQLSREKANKAT